MEKPLILALIIGISLATVLADVMLKKASIIKPSLATSILVIVSFIIYAITALGWYKVFQKIELLNAGVIFTLSFIILTALFSIFYFKEKLLIIEAVGLVLAIVSIIILYRYH